MSLTKKINQTQKFKDFENSEIARFLNKYYSYKEARLVFEGLTEENYPTIKDATKKGIRVGVDNFLKGSSEDGLYLSNLRKFDTDNSVKTGIEKTIEETGCEFKKEAINCYAMDVSQTYFMFVYNESKDIFDKRFLKEKKIN